jgi:hypothetical protein
LGHQSIISYVHGRCYIVVCVVLFKAEYNLSDSIVCPTFYSSRPWQLQCDLGPDRCPPGWLNPYIVGNYRLEVANNVFNGMEYTLSYRPATSHLVRDMAMCYRITWHYSGALQVVNRASCSATRRRLELHHGRPRAPPHVPLSSVLLGSEAKADFFTPRSPLRSPSHEDSRGAVCLIVPPSTGPCLCAMSSREAAPRVPPPPSSLGQPHRVVEAVAPKGATEAALPPPRASTMLAHAGPPPTSSTSS